MQWCSIGLWSNAYQRCRGDPGLEGIATKQYTRQHDAVLTPVSRATRRMSSGSTVQSGAFVTPQGASPDTGYRARIRRVRRLIPYVGPRALFVAVSYYVGALIGFALQAPG